MIRPPRSAALSRAAPKRLERVLKMERGCVEDQPQHLNTPEFREVLRLVEDDTAALRVFKTRA